MRLVSRLQEICMDMLFPQVCGVCGVRLAVGWPGKMCPDCRDKVRFLHQPICPICGGEENGPDDCGHLCGECLRRPPPYDLARSLVKYETAVRQLVHKLKYSGDTMAVGALSQLIKVSDRSLFADCDWIIPVPLHLARLRQRGLNQAAVLARLFFPERTRAIRPDGLVRVRSTVAQTALKGTDRRKNLKNAFGPGAGFDLEGSIVCLVDDVFTTGTTVSECSRVLKKCGAEEVRVLTLARAGTLRAGT